MLQPCINTNGVQPHREVLMPRKLRFVLPGEPQHVIIRGVNREPIFQMNQKGQCRLKSKNGSLLIVTTV